MIDSLQVFEILKVGNIPESQARAMTLAIQKAESDISVDLKSVIKEEIAALEVRFEAKLSETKVDILRWNFAFWVAQLAAMAAMLKLLR